MREERGRSRARGHTDLQDLGLTESSIMKALLRALRDQFYYGNFENAVEANWADRPIDAHGNEDVAAPQRLLQTVGIVLSLDFASEEKK